ncbi:MAG: hypothetical protein CMG00_06160 [Candidatus Marinimicrobia bacterium]|nr:hypothetical protein [Candidatus Neomarinimicrobiota bacterium]|tara:strand:+ start:3451 stop:4668 length:1218 start_codon:yes stop_codon:yes gene_type:complete
MAIGKFNLNDAGALFKIKYEKLSENIYNSANVLLGRCKKSYNFVGEKMRIAVPQSFAGGVGSGSLPTASKAKYGKAEISAKKVYARVEIDRETIKAALKDEGSFVRATKEVVKKGVESYMRNLSRILFSDGSGKLGDISSGSGSADMIITDASFKEANFEEGDLVDITETDGSSNVSVKAQGLEILAVDPDAKKVTLSASVSATGGSTLTSIYMQNSKDNDPEGLAGVIQKASGGKNAYGITSDRRWSSVEENALSAAVSTDLLNKVMLSVEKKCGKAPNLIVCSYKQYEKILNLLEDQKRYTVSTRAGLKTKSGADVSFSGVEFMSSSGPVGIFPERFCDDDKVYFLNDNHIHFYHRPDFGWFDDDGTVFLRHASEDSYEARYGGYFNIYINPAFHGVLKNLSV